VCSYLYRNFEILNEVLAQEQVHSNLKIARRQTAQSLRCQLSEQKVVAMHYYYYYYYYHLLHHKAATIQHTMGQITDFASYYSGTESIRTSLCFSRTYM